MTKFKTFFFVLMAAAIALCMHTLSTVQADAKVVSAKAFSIDSIKRVISDYYGMRQKSIERLSFDDNIKSVVSDNDKTHLDIRLAPYEIEYRKALNSTIGNADIEGVEILSIDYPDNTLISVHAYVKTSYNYTTDTEKCYCSFDTIITLQIRNNDLVIVGIDTSGSESYIADKYAKLLIAKSPRLSYSDAIDMYYDNASDSLPELAYGIKNDDVA